LDAVHIQRVGAGAGALQGQVPVHVPPLAVQHLIEGGGVVPVDGEAPGQGGVDVGVGVDKAGHDDAALGVDKLRLGIFGLQIRGRAHLQDLGAVNGHAAVGKVGQGAVPGNQFAVCQNVHTCVPPVTSIKFSSVVYVDVVGV